MKEIRKVGYNVLVVEGCVYVFPFALFWGRGSTKFWCFGMGRNSLYSVKANAAALKLPAVALSDLVEGIRVPRGPPYLSVPEF